MGSSAPTGRVYVVDGGRLCDAGDFSADYLQLGGERDARSFEGVAA